MEHISGTLLLQAIVSGLLLGLVYATMAMGLSLTMGILGIVNVAHSTFVMLGSYFAFGLLKQFGIDPLVSMALALPLFFVIGAALDRSLIRRVVVRTTETTGLLILFGVMVIIENSSILVWTTDTQVINVSYTSAPFFLGSITISKARLVAGILAVVVVGATHLFLQRTIIGKGIRAMAQNRDAARIMGVDVDRLSMIVFGVGTATAAIGGIALALIFPFTPQNHIRWLAWAFLIVIVGGLGSVRNILVSGLTVGLVEALSGVLLPFQYVYLIVYSLLALALIVRGQGLATTRRRTI
jgi:branched-chain amino acid transport system permease protein